MSFSASLVRSSGGKNWSSSKTPSLRSGGCWTMPTSVGRSSDCAGRPRVLDQVGEQDVLAARQRVGLDADQAEQAGDVPLDLVADDLGVVDAGHLQRTDDVHRHARLRARACRS